ncbi:hypothetical protein RUM43_014565 [Polyplax serrata]|uniref:WD repeat domain-containing protein 83 n=1 Tax=Polyplax serrata TaxID=468196 RepID=A0AAN8S3I7_POLSC
MDLKCLAKIKCDQGAVRAVRFNVDGCYSLTCGSDKKIKLWNPYKSLALKTYGGHADEVTDACGSCDSSQIISSGADKSVILWDVSSGQIVKRFRGHAGKVTCVKFNEESTVAVSGSQDNTVIFWDIKGRKNDPVQVLKDSKDCITSVQVTDHEILVSSLDSKIRFYDIRTGKVVSDFIGDPVTCAVFTRDSQCILSASEDIIRLMDKETGELLSEYTGHKTKNYIIESCVSLKDNFVFSGSADGNMWCWELLSSKCFKIFSHAPEKVIHSVAAHPTKEVYSTAAGGCIYLWSENPPE